MTHLPLLAALAMALALTGCVRDRAELHCLEPATGPEVMAAITACAEAANPKSDEEGEDLVAQCERTARETLCRREAWMVGNHSDDYRPCSAGLTAAQLDVCRAYGWPSPPPANRGER
jgi:hypothetical protein